MVSATLRAVDVQPRGVLQRLQQRVAEGVEEDSLDQRLRRLAAGAVRHRDAVFLDPRPGPAGPVDALQHEFLADGARQRLRRAVMLEPGGLAARLRVMFAQCLLHPARARHSPAPGRRPSWAKFGCQAG